MAESVDNDDAEQMLREEWDRVLTDDRRDYLSDDATANKIREVLNASQLTYKYILVTNVLAKAVNSNVHYRAMQAKSDLDGAYNARSLGHQVLVEWEKEHGERLGGSNEPFLNKPARDPEFALENAARSQSAQKRLYNLLERLQEKTKSCEIEPLNVLRHTLYEISTLESQTVDFTSPSDAPYREIESRVKTYVEKSGGGERLAAVTAGVMKAYYVSNPGDDWSITAEHANVPDEFSNDAGDVEINKEDELVRAIEVKDKHSERSDIQHAIKKAQENELGEYLYVVGDSWRDEREKQSALKEIEDAPIELILVYPDDILRMLKFVGEGGRVTFLEAVGEFLNDMRAEEENKDVWKELVGEIDEENR